MWIISEKVKGVDVPKTLKPNMVPPSLREGGGMVGFGLQGGLDSLRLDCVALLPTTVPTVWRCKRVFCRPHDACTYAAIHLVVVP